MGFLIAMGWQPIGWHHVTANQRKGTNLKTQLKLPKVQQLSYLAVLEHVQSKWIDYFCKKFGDRIFSKNVVISVVNWLIIFNTFWCMSKFFMVSLEFLPVQNQYLYVFPFRTFFLYFFTFSTSMLLFGTLGNNSRRKIEVVKLLILKYYLQFVVPITFMIGIRRKLSSILVKIYLDTLTR